MTVDSRRRRAWEVPECPVCGSKLWVWGAIGPSEQWECHRCEHAFDAPDPLETGVAWRGGETA